MIWHIPAVPVDVVDPTGAGNSYGGGACAGWAASQDARIAATYGAVSAWFLVSRTGLPKMGPSLRKQAEELVAAWKFRDALAAQVILQSFLDRRRRAADEQ